MHRRPLGRGRVLALAAAAIMLVACLLPWYAIGGGAGEIPRLEQNAFNGPGILVFVSALLTIALAALPYATGDRPVALDSWPAYLLLLALAAAGVVLWPIVDPGRLETWSGLMPVNAPGYWLAIIGVIVYARAVYEIQQHPVQR